MTILAAIGGTVIPPPPDHEVVSRLLARIKSQPADPRAIAWAGIAAVTGNLTSLSKSEAIDLIRRAADLGQPQAMSVYGNLLVTGNGVASNVLSGMKYLTKAMDSGEPMAWVYMGEAYANGPAAFPQDLKKAIGLLTNATQRTYRAWLPLARTYEVLEKWPEAANAFDQAARSGEHEAYFILSRVINGEIASPLSEVYHPKDLWHSLLLPGIVWRSAPITVEAGLYWGDAPRHDQYLARYLLRRARRGGSVQAAAILADAEATGAYDTHRDPKYAIAELEQMMTATLPNDSADLGARQDALLGQAEAQWRLGRQLVEGRYIAADPARGKTLIIGAAEAGSQGAKQWLSTQKLGAN